MKSKPNPFLSGRLASSLITATLLLAGPAAHAASDTWDGTTNNVWSLNTNWATDITIPGTGETATFNNAGNGNTIIDLGGGVTIGTILFDTSSAAAYTIGSGAVGSQTLTLNDTGAVTVNSTVVNNQLFNANITLGTAVTGTTSITNSSTTNSLTFAGNITGGTGGTAGTKTLNTSGAGAINIQGTINKGGASVINVANIGTGNTTLSGSGSSALGTLRATAAGTITVNNASANITVASSSLYGASSNYGKFILTAGTVAFNGGIQSATSSGAPAGSDGMAFIVNGGTFSASSVTLGRSWNFSTTSGATVTTAQSMSTSGFQVNGGTATVSGTVNLAGSNSAANGQVTGTGSLTIGGELILGSSSTRTTLFQVTGGTLTNTNTAGGGIVIGRGSATVASSGELLLTGGSTTTEKISFGLSGGLAGSYGNLTLNGSGASLYVGTGGIALAATNAFTQSINLMAGTLGAKADWASSMNMTLGGSGVTLKAADAADVAKNITLSGVLSGSNGFTKSGGGTLTLSGANGYTGTTTISAGILKLSGSGTIGATNSTLGAIASGAALDLNGTNQTIGQFSGTSAGQIQNNSGSGNSVLTVSGASPGSYSGVIADNDGVNTGGTVGLIVNTAGALGITGINSYSGGTTIQAGRINLNSESATLGSGAVTLTNGAILSFHRGDTNDNNSYPVFANELIIPTGQSGTVYAMPRGTWSGALTGNGTLNLRVNYIRGDVSGDWSGFTGQVNVTARTGNDDLRIALGGGGNGLNLSNGKLHLADGVNMYQSVNPPTGSGTQTIHRIGELSGAAGAEISGNPVSGRYSNWEIGALGTNSTYEGVIKDGAGASRLTKVGTGTLTLGGTNTYTGSTTISGGTLALGAAGSISTSTTIVNNATLDVSAVTGGFSLAAAQTLSGSGSVTGTMSVSGTLSPGNSPGTMTTGGQIWNDGGDYNWQILNATGIAGTGYDTIAITGTLDLTNLTAGGFHLNLWSLSSTGPDVNGNAINFSDVLSYSWVLASTTGGVSGFDVNDFTIHTTASNGAAGFANSFTGSFAVNVDGNNLVLTYAPIPEPRAALLGGLGMLILLRRRRQS